MSSQGSSESCRLQCQRHKTTGKKNVENWTQPGQEKKKQCKEIVGISILQPDLRERGRNPQYRQYGSALEQSTRVKFVMS